MNLTSEFIFRILDNFVRITGGSEECHVSVYLAPKRIKPWMAFLLLVRIARCLEKSVVSVYPWSLSSHDQNHGQTFDRISAGCSAESWQLPSLWSVTGLSTRNADLNVTELFSNRAFAGLPTMASLTLVTVKLTDRQGSEFSPVVEWLNGGTTVGGRWGKLCVTTLTTVRKTGAGDGRIMEFSALLQWCFFSIPVSLQLSASWINSGVNNSTDSRKKKKSRTVEEVELRNIHRMSRRRKWPSIGRTNNRDAVIWPVAIL